MPYKFEEVDNLRNNRQQAFQDNINKNLDDSLESEDLDNSDDSISIESEKGLFYFRLLENFSGFIF